MPWSIHDVLDKIPIYIDIEILCDILNIEPEDILRRFPEAVEAHEKEILELLDLEHIHYD